MKTAAATDIKKSNDAKIGDVAGVNSNGNGVLTEVFYDDVADTMVITQIVTYIGEVAKTVKATDKRDAYVVVIAKAGGNGLTRPVAKGTFEYETDETFADDAFVLYTYSVKADAVKSLAVAEKVEGYVTKTINSTKDEDKNNGMTISGTEYKMSLATAGEKLGNVSVKNDYTVYLDQYGYIIYVEQVQELGNYALVLATASKGSFIGNKAQLLLTDGTVKFVDTDENYATGDKKIKDNTIVTFRENSDKTYTLRKVNMTLSNTNDKQFSMTNDLAGITVESGKMVYANSASQFVISDKKDYTTPYSDIDDWTAYTGIKNAPTVKSEYGTTPSYANVDVYYYCKSGSMVTVMFIIPSQNATVIDGSKTTLYLSQKSRSDLIHDVDGDYFTYNAVVDGKIETVKVDVDAKCGTTAAADLNGLYSDYTVSSKGYITGLTKYGPYNNTSDKTAVNGVAGIDKTSKEYTVKLELKADGTYQYTITCADDMKVFYVDKKGNITESSYAAIYPDNNDLVYAVVDKYLVKTLVIFEQEDKGAESGTFDPANPQKAYIDGVEIVIPKVDGKFVDNAANVLVNNGYTVTGMFGSPATYWATKGGNTYFFTVKDPAPEYYTLTVDGTVVEYIKSSEASTTTWKQVKDAAKGGAGMLVNGTYAAYTDKIDTDKVVTGTSAATVIKTGYVGVTNSITGSDPAIVVDSYAKANSTFTVKATYSTAANANEVVVLTYDGTKTVTGVADTARKVFTFAVPAGVADVTLNSIAKVATYTVAAPKVVNGSGTEITGLKGLTVSAVADKTTAKSGETVTVTVTVKGLVETGGVTLKTNNGNWNGTASDTMTIAANTNYVTATQLVYSFVISADATPTITLS